MGEKFSRLKVDISGKSEFQNAILHSDCHFFETFQGQPKFTLLKRCTFFAVSLLLVKFMMSLNGYETLFLNRFRVDNYHAFWVPCRLSYHMLLLWPFLKILLSALVWLGSWLLVPDSFRLSQQSLFLTVFSPMDCDYFAKKLTVVHVENSMFAICQILVVQKGEVFSNCYLRGQSCLFSLRWRHHNWIQLSKRDKRSL
mgnify:CR=1 FL=1